MLCPQCKTKHREGYHKCADCDVPMVEHLPEEKNEEKKNGYSNITFVEVWETHEMASILFVHSTLNSNGIRCYIQCENMKLIRPADSVVLMVEEEDALRAVELLNGAGLKCFKTST